MTLLRVFNSVVDDTLYVIYLRLGWSQTGNEQLNVSMSVLHVNMEHVADLSLHNFKKKTTKVY